VLQGVFNTLNAYPLSRDFPHNGSAYIGLVSEVTKRWYAKRNRYLGDPDVVEIPYGEFSDPAAIAAVRENLDPTHPFPARRLPEFEVIRPQPAESEQTTHISILDREGNAVSMTYTLNGNFGSCMVAEGTGILLNNEMDDFAAKPGFPNMFGLVQGEANAVGPGKRMLSSMTPTIVEKDGQLAGLVGTPGGATIITSVMQIILSKIDYNLTLDAALKAGRFHQQWLPDTIYVEEDRFNAGDLEKLKEDGFKLVKRGRIGDIQAIWRSESGWEVCSDPRGNGRPFGY
ncbi:MAG TPA: gamma-glutamyltransferase, partial [Calditrichia bacterium]|nr:gamma-glutamyltransferase [Calditrichia bacterium]